MIYDVVFLIVSIFQTYIFYLWMGTFLGKYKVHKYVALMSYGGMYLAMTLPYMLIGIPIVTLICSYASNLAITLIYKGSVKKKIIVATFMMVMMALTECIVAIFSGYLELSITSPNEYYSLFGTVCLPIVQLIVVLAIRNFKNIRIGDYIPTTYWVLTFILPLISIYLLFMFYKQPHLDKMDNIYVVTGLLVLNVAVFGMYDRQAGSFKLKQEKERLQLQNHYQENQLTMMNQVVENSRSQKHDFYKHLSMIGFYVKEGKDKEAGEYIANMTGQLNIEKEYVDSGNFELDSIINYKIYEAISQGIAVDSNVKIPENLSISTYDMNIVLSNALDNAITAASQSMEKALSINIGYDKAKLTINITNSYVKNNQENFEDLENIKTTKADKENHGYGIKNIKQIVEKYDGFMEIKAGDKFKIFICIFL